MFIPNNRAQVKSAAGFDRYGQPRWGAPRWIRCGVVSLNMTTERTSVRTDSSATRGNAEELAASAKILFPIHTVAKGDKVHIAGFQLRVIDVQPRFAVTGRHDHDECLLSIWQEKAP